MLKRVLDIKLTNLNMEDRSDSFKGGNEDLSVAFKMQLGEVAQFNNQSIFAMNIRIQLAVSSDDIASNTFAKEKNIEKLDMLTFLKADFKVGFETDENEFNKDELKNELANYVEPYFREFIDNIYNRTEVSVPSIPIGIILGSIEA